MINGIYNSSNNPIATYQKNTTQNGNTPQNQVQSTDKSTVNLDNSTNTNRIKKEEGSTKYDIDEIISMIQVSQQIIKSEFAKPIAPPTIQVHKTSHTKPLINIETSMLTDIENDPAAVDENDDGVISQKEVQDFMEEKAMLHPKPPGHP